MERLREAEVTSAHAKARLHMFWAWTPDATPGELCVVYATTFICQFLPDTPDRKLILTTEQAVTWVRRYASWVYEYLFFTSSKEHRLQLLAGDAMSEVFRFHGFNNNGGSR